MPEPRSPVMILVEASWEDQNGTLETARACMVNRSVSGTCIRIKEPLGVGTRLTIQWRWEEISGVAKYCRRDGTDYLIGIQRDTPANGDPSRLAAKPGSRENRKRSNPRVLDDKTQSRPKGHESKPIEPPVSKRSVETAPTEPTSSLAAARVALRVARKAGTSDTGRIRQLQEFDALRRKELQMLQPPKTKEAGKARKYMTRKWLGLGNWGDKPEEVNGNSSANTDPVDVRKPGPTMFPRAEKPAAGAVEDQSAGVPDELMVLEDIYRTAGIATPRKGYNITKVVEMLHSEHMRGLSKELKRASVLMALDAAGISTEALLDDAKARLEAIDSYEAAQRKQFEAEWARRAEENVQIQSELESLKARYMDRLKRNQDGVAREKATFGSWLTVKQQESQSILEAVELCLKPAASEPTGTSHSAVTVADAVNKPV
jgi:hypothetical protein